MYEKACRVEEGCTCVLRVTVTKCCCVGSTVKEIPQALNESVKTLVIEDSETLTFIDGNAFGKLRNLGKISVSGCKNLKEITGTLLINNTKILSLIIEENGLVRMPTLRMTNEHRFAMELIDFSYNEIEYLGDGQIRSVHANELRLSHNRFREIGGHVFADCKFSYLYLNDNMELKRMSMNTFGGISLIQNLDLSRTAISELPTKGLSKLERLKVEDTDNLKKLPTILAFTSLKRAQFTYPYHCCLFKHASKEIDQAGKEFTQNYEEIKSRECSAKAKALSRTKRNLIRRKRSVERTVDSSVETPLDLSDLFLWFDSVNNGDVLIEVGDDSPELDPEFDDEQIGQLTNFNCTSNAVSDFFASIQCSPMPNALNPCENVVG
uniref:Lutropin-choriogonadotropic hormone receptor n=1 Tax=Ascaris suum TaxID=6253 RepID=F1L3U3_ASCSU